MHNSGKETLRKIFSITELTSNIKDVLESSFPLIWISGEISNFRKPFSGHFYFTLKDESSQISSVMFKGQNRNLIFSPKDGMMITGLGRISVYEPRGTYQVILEYLEPKGAGAMQAAFEQTKKRLFEQGLFDEQHKRPLPFLPNKIGIITSPGGAVIHDILKIINRRFPDVHIQIVPVRVQGKGAENEIVSSIELINRNFKTDVIILARGGGALEDLHAFNSEEVAQAVFASKIPVISAIGHETDFTISDFTADLRAPTPSAAAEMLVPLKNELTEKCSRLSFAMLSRMNQTIHNHRSEIEGLSNRLVSPKKKIDHMRLRHDEVNQRLTRMLNRSLHQKKEHLAWRIDKLRLNTPSIHLNKVKDKHDIYRSKLSNYIINTLINNKRSQLREACGRLQALNPSAILSRGYSITRTIPEAVIVRNAGTVDIDQRLEVVLAKGSLMCRIERKQDNGKTDL